MHKNLCLLVCSDFQILIHEMFLSQLDQLEVTSSRSRLFGLLDSPGNRQVTNPQQQQPVQLSIVHPQTKTDPAFEACPCSLTLTLTHQLNGHWWSLPRTNDCKLWVKQLNYQEC